jgi:hypothetical protein
VTVAVGVALEVFVKFVEFVVFVMVYSVVMKLMVVIAVAGCVVAVESVWGEVVGTFVLLIKQIKIIKKNKKVSLGIVHQIRGGIESTWRELRGSSLRGHLNICLAESLLHRWRGTSR